MDGYFLKGIDNECLLVFRSYDSEEILSIIQKLATTRNKELRALAYMLEIQFYERYHDDIIQIGSKNPKPHNGRNRRKGRTTKNPKHRS